MTRDSIFANIETLPVQRQIAMAASLGQAGTFMLGDKSFHFDFTGQSDADFQKAADATARSSAFTNAQTALDLQNQFGAKFVTQARDQLRMSDPIGFALREGVGKRVSDQFNLGGATSDDERRLVSQSVRAGQTRLGNTAGVAAGVQEVMAQADYQRALEQQRLSNAGNFLAGTAPQAEFGQLRSAGAGAAPMLPGSFTAPTLNPNAGGQGLQFASSIYGSQMQGYGSQVSAIAQQGNPWMQGLGIGLGALTTLGGAAIGAGLLGGTAAGGAVRGGWSMAFPRGQV